MDRSVLLTNIDAAKRDVKAAEADMATILRDLRVKARAEKTTISAALDAAFTKLRGALTHLEALETMLASDREDL